MTNNLRDEIARRRERANFGTAEHQQELAALADAVAVLEKVLPWLEREVGPQYAGVGNDGYPIEREPEPREEACGMSAMVLRAALAQIAGRLGHMDVGREGEG